MKKKKDSNNRSTEEKEFDYKDKGRQKKRNPKTPKIPKVKKEKKFKTDIQKEQPSSDERVCKNCRCYTRPKCMLNENFVTRKNPACDGFIPKK